MEPQAAAAAVPREAVPVSRELAAQEALMAAAAAAVEKIPQMEAVVAA
jgi:hypothetical protein